MAPKTVQQLFGLKPEELNALTVLSGLEGYRGGRGEDVAAVAANVLGRRLKGNWGGRDIRNIAKAPGQYEAVFDYSMQQLADPAFGAKVLGGKAEFDRLQNIVNDPGVVGQQFIRSKGAQSFRGTALYGNKKPEDYAPIPGKSNFYFNPLDPKTYQQGLNLFGGAATQASPSASSGAQPSVEDILSSTLAGKIKPGLEEANKKATSLVDTVKESLIRSLLSPIINPLGTL